MIVIIALRLPQMMDTITVFEALFRNNEEIYKLLFRIMIKALNLSLIIPITFSSVELQEKNLVTIIKQMLTLEKQFDFTMKTITHIILEEIFERSKTN